MNTSERTNYTARRALVCIKNTQVCRTRPASARPATFLQEKPSWQPHHTESMRCQTPSRRSSHSRVLPSRAQTPKPRSSTLASPFFKQKRVDCAEPTDLGWTPFQHRTPSGRSPLRMTSKGNADLRPGSFSKKQILTTAADTKPAVARRTSGLGRSDRLKELSRNFQLEKPQLATTTEEPRRCQAKKENVRPGLDRPLPWPEVLTEVEVIARMRAVKRQRPVRKR